MRDLETLRALIKQIVEELHSFDVDNGGFYDSCTSEIEYLLDQVVEYLEEGKIPKKAKK